MTPEERQQEMIDRYNRSLKNTTDGPKMSAIVCPKHYGKDKLCMLCDLTFAYFRAKLGKEHFLRPKALGLNRKISYYSNVIFPQNPSDVVVFQYGEELFKLLFGYAMDKASEYVGYMHPKTGRNFVIKKDIPGGNKRQTQYTIEMRSAISQIPDPSVIGRMYNLDNVRELEEQGKIKIVSQRDLAEGRTEVRMLPSWLGPKFDYVFYANVPFHYINKDEFDAIQAGKINPYAEAGIALASSKPEQPAPIIIQPPPIERNENSQWGEWDAPATADPRPLPSGITTGGEGGPKPPCFGTYDATSPLCNQGCAPKGIDVQGCMMASKAPQDQNAELRRVASKLYK